MQLDAKQKKMALIIGAIVLILLFVYLRAQGARSAAASPRAAALPQPSGAVDFSPLAGPFQSVIDALNQSQQGLVAIAQNQATSILSEFQTLGSESWLSCLPAGGGRPDAACIKAKGNVVPAGFTNVSGVKTQSILDQQYTAPYATCKKSDQSYDLACVGALIAGSPSVNTVNLNKSLPQQPTVPPSNRAAITPGTPQNAFRLFLERYQ